MVASDSENSIKALTVWRLRWIRNGWVSSSGKPVKNRQHIQRIVEMMKELRTNGLPVEFMFVKGHAGVKGNVIADALAKNCIRDE